MDDNSFLLKKLERIYKMLDFDRNGYVQRKEFVVWAEKAANIAGVTLTNEMRKSWMAAFDAYFGDSRNFKEWVDHYMNVSLKVHDNIQGIAKYQAKINLPLFKAVDINGSNTITWNEYRALVLPLGVSEPEAKAGFEMIDSNGDGVLSFEEFSYASTMYYADKTDSKYKHFYGKFESYDDACDEDENCFLLKKLERLYEMLDFDRNGYVQRKEFVVWAEKAANIAGVTLTTEMRKSWMAAFDAYFGDARSFKEWVNHHMNVSMKVHDNIQGIAEYQAKINLPLFKAVDVNGSNTITWNEYRALVLPLGVSEQDAKAGFEMIDSNGDGVLSFEEFSYASTMYYADKTNSKYKHFYGKFE